MLAGGAGITQVKVGLGSVLGNDQRLLREILLAGEFPPKTQADQTVRLKIIPPPKPARPSEPEGA